MPYHFVLSHLGIRAALSFKSPFVSGVEAKMTNLCFRNPAGNFDVDSMSNRRNFDVEKALKNARIFRSSSKRRRNFDVDISTVFIRR